MITVTVDDDLYQQQLKRCEASLIGRLVLAKGYKPWTLADLKRRLQDLWNPLHPWSMISLGKGYSNLQFDSMTDRASTGKHSFFFVRYSHAFIHHYFFI